MNSNKIINQIGTIASSLISFQTIDGNKEEVMKLYAYVEKLFKYTKYSVSIDSTPDFPICIIQPKYSTTTNYICSHIDVVDGNRSQFEPFIVNNTLYGRGAYDMKTQAALSLALLLNTDVKAGVILTSDEEASKSENGATYVADLLKGKANLVIVPDGETSLAITNKVKGMGEYKFISTGKAHRYSYPWKGINPYISLMHLYLSLEKVFLNAQKASDENIWYTTYNLISIDAVDGSQVPEIGSMNVLVNFTTEFNRRNLLKLLKKVALKFECDVVEIFYGAPYEVSGNNNEVKRFKKILDKFVGYRTELLTMGAITDVRHFSEKNIATILCRIDGSGAHSEKEYADLNSAVKLYYALKDYLS